MILLIQLLFLLSKFVFSFDFDLRYPIIYENPKRSSKSSYFGFSVVLRPKVHNDSWVLQIGAPRANVSNDKKGSNFTETGGAYRCSHHGPCRLYHVDKEDYGKGHVRNTEYKTKKDGAFIGVSMDVKETFNGEKSVICGHRWINEHRDYYPDEKKKSEKFVLTYLMSGACYLTNNSEHGRINAQKILPLVNKDYVLTSDNLAYFWGLGQAGISVEFDEDPTTVIIGAPGVFRDGSVIKFNSESNLKVQVFKDPQSIYAYAGYQVGKGKFFGDGKLWYLAGAPRAKAFKGEVIVFQFSHKPGQEAFTRNIPELVGETVGDYFGASLLVTDINNDRLDDIIVGAPLFSSKEPDQGKIYVFFGQSMGSFKPAKNSAFLAITGKAPFGRFGSCIAALGDLNKDKYNDVAVGAPYENNHRGAVYIYKGSQDGLELLMKIPAEDVYDGLRGFGFSISKGVDIDGNLWNDMAVGAYLSDQVVLLRARPSITLHPTIEPDLYRLNRIGKLQLKIKVCSKFDGAYFPEPISVVRTIQLDPTYRRIKLAEIFNRGKQPNLVETIQYSFNKSYCEDISLSGPEIINGTFSSPVEIFVTNELPPCGENKKQSVIINGGDQSLKKEDQFLKWCPVGMKKEVSYKIPFAGECGENEICETDLEISCSIAEARDNFYVVGNSKHITLSITIKNSKEPANNAKIVVDSNLDLFESKDLDLYKEWKFNDVHRNVARLDFDTPLGTNYERKIKLAINIEQIQQRKFTESQLEIHVKATSNSTELNPLNNECRISLQLASDMKVTLSALSSTEIITISGDLDNQLINFTNYYEVKKFGRSPALGAELTINIPTRHLGAEVATIITEISETIQQSFSEGGMTDIEMVFKEDSFSENKLVSSDSPPANRTFFLNCSSADVECTKLNLFFPNGIPTDEPVSVDIFIILNFSAIDSSKGDNDYLYFTTDGNLQVPLLFNVDPLILSANTSIVIFKEKLIAKPVEAYVIALSVLGGALLLSLIISALLKSNFFKRTKRDELNALKSNELFEVQQKFIDKEIEIIEESQEANG